MGALYDLIKQQTKLVYKSWMEGRGFKLKPGWNITLGEKVLPQVYAKVPDDAKKLEQDLTRTVLKSLEIAYDLARIKTIRKRETIEKVLSYLLGVFLKVYCTGVVVDSLYMFADDMTYYFIPESSVERKAWSSLCTSLGELSERFRCGIEFLSVVISSVLVRYMWFCGYDEDVIVAGLSAVIKELVGDPTRVVLDTYLLRKALEKIERREFDLDPVEFSRVVSALPYLHLKKGEEEIPFEEVRVSSLFEGDYLEVDAGYLTEMVELISLNIPDLKAMDPKNAVKITVEIIEAGMVYASALYPESARDVGIYTSYYHLKGLFLRVVDFLKETIKKTGKKKLT